MSRDMKDEAKQKSTFLTGVHDASGVKIGKH